MDSITTGPWRITIKAARTARWSYKAFPAKYCWSLTFSNHSTVLPSDCS
jgi:hypothetical protein